MTSGPRPLFEINPGLDRQALAARFARDKRIQIRSVLTEETAQTISRILQHETPWGLAWRAGANGPNAVRAKELSKMDARQHADMVQQLNAAISGEGYAFTFHQYPMLDAYLQKWDSGSPQDLLLEYLNDHGFLSLVRDVTGEAGLIKADAQATLYAPGQFLALHDDSHVAEGWKIAYVLNFCTEDWRPDWGGYLLFYDEDGDVVAGYRPRFNALNLFAVPQAHNVTYVPPFSPVARFAITGWVRNK